MINKLFSRPVLFGLAAIAVATPLSAANTNVVETRVAAYKELGAAFKSANDELRTGNPDGLKIQAAAREIRKVANQQYDFFPAGSHTGNTGALPAIWQKPAAFKAAQDNFAKQAESFFTLTRQGDMAAVGSAMRGLGQACKACHDEFRKD